LIQETLDAFRLLGTLRIEADLAKLAKNKLALSVREKCRGRNLSLLAFLTQFGRLLRLWHGVALVLFVILEESDLRPTSPGSDGWQSRVRNECFGIMEQRLGRNGEKQEINP
jgi:hypothetical protein